MTFARPIFCLNSLSFLSFHLETEDGKENPKLRRALQRGRSRSMIIGDQGEGGTEGIQRRKKSTKNYMQIDLWHPPETHNLNYHVFLLYPSIWRFKRKTNIRNETEEKIIAIESGSAAVTGAQTQVQVLGSDGEVEWEEEKRKPREGVHLKYLSIFWIPRDVK